MADIVGISLSWWEAWYLPPFYLDSSSILYILEFLVADIAVYWILADGYSSAGRTGLGSAVLAGFIIGEELPVRSSPLGRLCFLANDFLLSLTLLVILLNTSSTRKSWLVWSLFSLVGVWWFWWEALYLPLLYMDTSSILHRCAY